jgi:hypothetical protein
MSLVLAGVSVVVVSVRQEVMSDLLSHLISGKV